MNDGSPGRSDGGGTSGAARSSSTGCRAASAIGDDDDTSSSTTARRPASVDMDGKRYIDYHSGSGRSSSVTAIRWWAAVAEAAAEGDSFAMTQRREIEAAEKVRRPSASGPTRSVSPTPARRRRCTPSGSPGRRPDASVIVKFEGPIPRHARLRAVLHGGGAGEPPRVDAVRPVPSRVEPGYPRRSGHGAHRPLQRPRGMAERASRPRDSGSPLLIVEPMLGNVFGLMPLPGYLEGLRQLW